jgi:hypothetical protein
MTQQSSDSEKKSTKLKRLTRWIFGLGFLVSIAWAATLPPLFGGDESEVECCNDTVDNIRVDSVKDVDLQDINL